MSHQKTLAALVRIFDGSVKGKSLQEIKTNIHLKSAQLNDCINNALTADFLAGEIQSALAIKDESVPSQSLVALACVFAKKSIKHGPAIRQRLSQLVLHVDDLLSKCHSAQNQQDPNIEYYRNLLRLKETIHCNLVLVFGDDKSREALIKIAANMPPGFGRDYITFMSALNK
jgi:hypothetical protein